MLHTKKYMYIFTVITLMSCSCNLVAMKEIKNHGLKVVNSKGARKILNQNTLKVFYAPFLDQRKLSSFLRPIIINLRTLNPIIIAFNTKIVAFCDRYTIKIWDIEKGICINTLDNGKIHIENLTKLTDKSIAFVDANGQIIIWDFSNKNKKTLNLSENPPIAADISEAKYAILNIATGNCLKTLYGESPEIIERLSDTKIIYNYFGGRGQSGLGRRDRDFKIVRTIKCDPEENDYVFEEDEDQPKDSKITCYSKPSEQLYAIGYHTTTKETNTTRKETKEPFFQVYDSKTDKFLQKINTKNVPYFLINLPNDNAIISSEKYNRIEVWDLKNPAINIQKIHCSKFLYKVDFKNEIILIDYFKEKDMIMAITTMGYIIKIQCASNNKKSKDINYLFQNLNISKDKKPFRDLGFKFKYNYNTEN